MATANKELLAGARQSLTGHWGIAIGTNLIYWIIYNAASLAWLVVGGPFELGLKTFSLNLGRGKKADIEQLFDGFKNFSNSLVAYLLMVLFVFLWTLLFIIPGIIAAIAYSQVFFIQADDAKISGSDALKKSREMMNGYKWKYFCFTLRFTGWFILSILTMGIGFLWLAPYFNVSAAKFYDDIKAAK